MSRSVADTETGEIIDHVVKIVTEQQGERNKEYKKRRELYKTLNRKFGNFFFYKYDTLLKDINDNVAIAFRFLYICGFADKNSVIKLPDDRVCTKKDHFIELFNCPKQSAYDFHDQLLNHELIYVDFAGHYRINESYYSYGINDDGFKKNSVRTFNRAVRELYNKLSSKQHALGGELMKLVPYINIHNNILCTNITSSIQNSDEVLTKEDLQQIIRPSSEYGKKLRLKLEKMTIHDEPIIAKVISGESYYYVMNPRFFYRGNNITEFKALIDQFSTATNITRQKREMRKRKEFSNHDQQTTLHSLYQFPTVC